jgi:hypothetical protein
VKPEMQIVFTALLSALTSSGVMSLVIYLIQRRDKQREKEEANNSAQSRMLLGLGHDRIIYLTDKFVRRGSITLKEKRNLKFLCDPYFDLGGNGDCKIGYDACDKLPVVSEDEAEAMDEKLRRKEYGYETEQ